MFILNLFSYAKYKYVFTFILINFRTSETIDSTEYTMEIYNFLLNSKYLNSLQVSYSFIFF